ncbi:MAG: hypothetical protein R2783_08605 [Gelidibacter sp.]
MEKPTSSSGMIDTNKWSCMTIKATAKNGTVYSNTITITSLIPDPNTNN